MSGLGWSPRPDNPVSPYIDDGCDVAPHCLECPLPVCRFDMNGGAPAIKRIPRDRAIAKLRNKGVSKEDIAIRYGISVRSVHRILAVAPA